MSNSCTKNGLKQLAKIVAQARGDLSYRQFEALIEKVLLRKGINGTVPHATIRRIEVCDWRRYGPDRETLIKIACVLPYTVDELQAIMSSSVPDSYPQRYQRAEDVMPFVNQLSSVEKVRLIRMIDTYPIAKDDADSKT